MTAKERIICALRCQPVDRAPWMPLPGCHGARLINATIKDYVSSAENIVAAADRAIALYNPDGIPVAGNLMLESEVLGCKLLWKDSEPPVILEHPLETGKSIKNLSNLKKTSEGIHTCMQAAVALRSIYPDMALAGIITGPFSLAWQLAGNGIFRKIIDEPEQVEELVNFATRVAQKMAKWYIDSGCDMIIVADHVTNQLDSASFGQTVAPFVSGLIDLIRDLGGLSAYFVGGLAGHNLEAMCRCRPDSIFVDQIASIAHTRSVVAQNGISFATGIQPVDAYYSAKPGNIGKKIADMFLTTGRTGFLMTTGHELDYHASVENLKTIGRLISELPC